MKQQSPALIRSNFTHSNPKFLTENLPFAENSLADKLTYFLKPLLVHFSQGTPDYSEISDSLFYSNIKILYF